VPRRSILYHLPLSLSCYRDRERGYSERDPSPRRKRAPSPPTDQRFDGWPLGRVRQPPQSTWALSPPTDQRFEGWPLGRVRQPPQSTRAPRPPLVRGSKAGPSEGFDSRLRALGLRALLLIRGSKAGPSEGFDSRLRALGLHAHHWSEVRRLAPRMGSTAASSHSGSAPTTDQGFVG
jgi:hypothetical protein